MSYGINHQVGIKASPEEIYKALTETEKLAQWWTTDTRGSGTKVGATSLSLLIGNNHVRKPLIGPNRFMT